MSVSAILDKLTDHNTGVIGCLATHGEQSFHNLSDAYELVNASSVGEEAAQMFQLMDSLESPTADFEEFFLEMRNHSVFAHRLDNGVLVVLNKRVDRAAFRRLKVGVNLFVNPLRRELARPTVPIAPPPAQPMPTPSAQAAAPIAEDPQKTPAKRKTKKRYYRGIEY